MVGTTRNRTRASAANESPANQTMGDTPFGTPSASNSSTSENVHMQDNDARSREGTQPMPIRGKTPLLQQPQDAAGEAGRLGFHVRDIISTIQQLEGLGLQQHDIPLPKIIVLGEQSTGKSSVIESISGIKTPRSTGTCTRCPLFIKLESPPDPDAPWTARVTLRRLFNYDGKKGRSPERRFPGWLPRAQPEDVAFAVINDPNMLEDTIRRAQSAIISPWSEPKDFLDRTKDHLIPALRCSFSPNVVCISISQPDLPALSFYDLPGIVGQSEDLAEVKFVKDLVTEYINYPEALILVTCAMDNDIANSTAAGIARSLKATDRCIGVLTKPDRVTVESRQEKLQEVFFEKRFPFGHGYFVVRNLDQGQLTAGLSHRDARLQEKQFFEDEEPWASVSQDVKSRFGTSRLQEYLSGKLAEQITNRLPTIRKQIDDRLLELGEQLKHYPEPPKHSALTTIIHVVTNFSTDVCNEIAAEWPCTDWRNSWEALQKALFDALVSLKPTMATCGRRDRGIYAESLASGTTVGASANQAIDLEASETEGEEDGAASSTPNPETPTKKRKLEEATSGPSPLKNQRSVGRIPSPDFSEKRTKFQLDAVAQHLGKTSKAKVPGQIEPRVTNAMMLATLEHWDLPLKEFFDTLEKQLRIQLKVIFHKHFVKWEGTALYSSAWKIVMDMLNLYLDQQRTTMAGESLDDEKAGPYIFHDDIFSREKESVVQAYRQARFKARMTTYKKERQHRLGKEMSSAEEAKMRKDEKVMALINYEPYSVQLDVVADVVTYYMFAARRFHDSVCMRIESKFFMQLRTQLLDELENGLGIHDEVEGHRNAVRLLAEQSDRERQRQELLANMSALQKGQKILIDLEKKKYGGDNMSRITSFGAGSDSTSFGIPTPLPEEMDEMDEV